MKISPFQFTRPVMTKASFEVKPTEEGTPLSADLHVQRNIIRIEGKNQALVQVTVQINKKGAEERENAAFVAEVAMQSLFTWDENLDEKQVQSLLENNASALLISYIRPIVSVLTTASPLSVYDIPFINLSDIS